MLPRNRVLEALNHREPDKIPRDLGSPETTLWPSIASKLYKYFNIDEKVIFMDQRTRSVSLPEKILEKFNIDTRWVYMKPARSAKDKIQKLTDGLYIKDDWGMEFVLHSKDSRPEYKKFPLSHALDEDDIEKHSWPDPFDSKRVLGLREEAKRFYDRGFAVGIKFGGVWERSWYLRGMEQIMIDLAINPTFAYSLFRKILDIQLKMYDFVLQEIGKYLSIVCFSSDMGTQSSLLISPDLWRKYIRPCDQELVNLFKRKTKAKIAHHACGSVRNLISEYIEMGIEILNPIQTTAIGMDPYELKREFGRDICFWGGIDTQNVLPFGSTYEVSKHVKKIINAFSEGGGYLFATCQNIQDDVPLENIMKIYDTLNKYGPYKTYGKK